MPHPNNTAEADIPFVFLFHTGQSDRCNSIMLGNSFIYFAAGRPMQLYSHIFITMLLSFVCVYYLLSWLWGWGTKVWGQLHYWVYFYESVHFGQGWLLSICCLCRDLFLYDGFMKGGGYIGNPKLFSGSWRGPKSIVKFSLSGGVGVGWVVRIRVELHKVFHFLFIYSLMFWHSLLGFRRFVMSDVVSMSPLTVCKE